MKMAVSRVFCVLLALVAAVSVMPVEGKYKCPGGFANFGDSLTDTGNALDLFPFVTDAELPPYGEKFFGAPAKRFGDGRIVNDFISLAFKVPLLDAYFATTVLDYGSGVNFAVGGATATINPNALVPFPFYPTQVNQFIRFKNSAKAVKSERACASYFNSLPSQSSFSNWLYTIQIGGNDIILALSNPLLTPENITSIVIPQAIGNITAGIKALYAESAREFLVFNIPAQGCATVILTALEGLGLPTDPLGCLISVNQINQVFNIGLLAAIKELRTELPGSTISYFDYYGANLEILSNASYYGFDPTKILDACCGAPGSGTYNYNVNITCGHPELGSNNCANSDLYVNWDGVHFTDHFNRLIAEFVLAGKFTDVPVNYTASCKLDFSKFGSQVTYTQAYPYQCENLFN